MDLEELTFGGKWEAHETCCCVKGGTVVPLTAAPRWFGEVSFGVVEGYVFEELAFSDAAKHELNGYVSTGVARFVGCGECRELG